MNITTKFDVGQSVYWIDDQSKLIHQLKINSIRVSLLENNFKSIIYQCLDYKKSIPYGYWKGFLMEFPEIDTSKHYVSLHSSYENAQTELTRRKTAN